MVSSETIETINGGNYRCFSSSSNYALPARLFLLLVFIKAKLHACRFEVDHDDNDYDDDDDDDIFNSQTSLVHSQYTYLCVTPLATYNDFSTLIVRAYKELQDDRYGTGACISFRFLWLLALVIFLDHI